MSLLWLGIIAGATYTANNLYKWYNRPVRSPEDLKETLEVSPYLRNEC